MLRSRTGLSLFGALNSTERVGAHHNARQGLVEVNKDRCERVLEWSLLQLYLRVLQSRLLPHWAFSLLKCIQQLKGITCH